MATANELYTRGAPGDADNRGESLVQQHLDRMQQQKEAAAMERLRTLMPQMGDVVRALALSKADWDLDQAVSMLRSFQVAHLDKVNNLNKKRKKIREAMESYTGRESDAKPSPSSSGKDDSSSSSSGGSSDEEGGGGDEAQHREQGKEKKQRSSRSKKHKKRSERDDKKARRKERKRSTDKKKRQKRSRNKGGRSSSDEEDDGKPRKITHNEEFGKHGYIREGDMHLKEGEFRLWAGEVKGANVELLGRAEERELFKEYMEDYNTGTLKHRKYYDLDAWTRYQAQKAAYKNAKAAGAKAGGGDAVFDARADEEAIKRARIEERVAAQQARLSEAYHLLKHTDRAKDMREQELLRAEMALAYKTGDRARAEKIYNRLLPDDQKK